VDHRPGQRRLRPAWWTVILIVACLTFATVCSALFNRSFESTVPVTLTSDRAGLVMESGAKVKLRGVQVGRVAGVEASGPGPVRLKLELDSGQVRFIPENVGAQIQSTTAFGAKYVELLYPDSPVAQRISAGAVLVSRNVTTEVNTVFQNLVSVLHRIDVPKLNAVITALADGVRGQGKRIGEATTDANEVLGALNSRMDTLAQDWRSAKGFNDTYSAAAHDILTILDAASTTSATLTAHGSQLDELMLGTVGLSRDGLQLLAPNGDTAVHAINTAEPTTSLLLKYNPELICTLLGAQWVLNNGGFQAFGGNGYSVILDAGLLFGDDPYQYPDNLPIVAAKGGPGGQPGCGSLPDVTKNFPVRQLVTNTGWGTGLDIRPNPGIGHPCWTDFLPVTRAVPEPPKIRNCIPGPAIGPVPYPGAPPYGAPLYGPDGAPLYPPPPGAPPAPEPGAAPVNPPPAPAPDTPPSPPSP